MSLIGFHKVLIATGILFCGGFGGWQLLRFARGGGTATLAVGLLATLAAVGLGVYLALLGRFLGHRER